MEEQKLYPPYIEGKIPAQVGEKLKIPFAHNRAVNLNNISGMAATIKTIFSGDIICELSSTNIVNNIVEFDISNQSLNIGQHYKIQLAYKNIAGERGYDSTVGVFKYTAQPTISIVELDEKINNPNLGTYQGVYKSPEEDISEVEYSYEFNLRKNNELVDSTGELIHNSSSEFDVYRPNINFLPNVYYQLEYKVITINNLILSSVYTIFESPISTYPEEYNCSLIATPNFDSGSIKLRIEKNNDNYLLQGNYQILRFHNNIIENLGTFSANTRESFDVFEDLFVEHGIEYQYALQKIYSDTLLANKLASEKIICYFDHMFLSDGERQLAIKFDPKVSSFKTTLSESKVDTMGSKYPFFFRNGAVAYKEFPISGLISILCDENNSFINNRQITPANDTMKFNIGTDLTNENFLAERQFKLEVLNWLNNGKPKVFRSPAEGSYIVRLMNVSLSPKDQLGRMIHSFNSTAYEIMEYNIQNLKENNFTRSIKDYYSLELKEIELPNNDIYSLDLNTSSRAEITALEDSKISLEYSNGYIVEDIKISTINPYIPYIPTGVQLTTLTLISGKIKVNYIGYPEIKEQTLLTQVTYEEKLVQYDGEVIIDESKNINLLLGLEGDSVQSKELITEQKAYNIIHLYLTAIPSEYYESINEDTYKIKIQFMGDSTAREFDIAPEITTLSNENLEAWQTEIHPGDRVYTNENMVDNLFNLKYFEVGPGVYANIYYGISTYS